MRSTPRENPVRYVIAAIGAAVLLGVLYVVFVRTEIGQLVDQLAYDGAEFGQRSVTPFTWRLLDSLPTVAVVMCGVLAVVIVCVRRNWLTLGVALGAACAATATTQILKYLVFDRPDLGIEGYASNSFPSGHTTVAAASALVVFLVSSPRTRAAVAAGGAAFTVVAGASTLANQWHRPSDVIAAFLVVAVWGCIAAAVLAATRPLLRTDRAQLGGRGFWWVVLPLLVVAAFAFVITFRGAEHANPNTVLAYIGGMSAILVTGLLLAWAATRAFAHFQPIERAPLGSRRERL